MPHISKHIPRINSITRYNGTVKEASLLLTPFEKEVPEAQKV